MNSTSNDVATQSEPALLRLADVARLLDVSPRFVHNLRNNGAFPAPVKLGRSVRWRRDAINEWVRRGCPTA